MSKLSIVNVNQFYGIEISEFPARIAEVALWMMDHIMNVRLSLEFGQSFARIPLKVSPHICHADALEADWGAIIDASDCDYIFGNPPFIGHHLQSPGQKALLKQVYGPSAKSAGVMDFVTAWFVKSADYAAGQNTKMGFVATNSITQGEQVGILWRSLAKYNLTVNFAHRTFRWESEARGKAAVYCVIIGFWRNEEIKKRIFDYVTPDGEPHEAAANRINAYLVDGPWVLIENRSRNLFGMPEMMYGSKPTDGGHLLFDDDEKRSFLRLEPAAKNFVKKFLSAKEYLYGKERWVLWLVGAKPSELKDLPLTRKRIQEVATFRKASSAPSTRAYLNHSLFRQITQPNTSFILVPGHTSERREYIPFGFFEKENIVGNSCFSLPSDRLFHFCIIQSAMHMAWIKAVCGRLESRFRYSKDIVYNNFPWPEVSQQQIRKVELLGSEILRAREIYPDSSPADLYDPDIMPSELRKAHRKLDLAVDKLYRKETFSSERERVEFLFDLYAKTVMPLDLDVLSLSKIKTRKAVKK